MSFNKWQAFRIMESDLISRSTINRTWTEWSSFRKNHSSSFQNSNLKSPLLDKDMSVPFKVFYKFSLTISAFNKMKEKNTSRIFIRRFKRQLRPCRSTNSMMRIKSSSIWLSRMQVETPSLAIQIQPLLTIILKQQNMFRPRMIYTSLAM